MGMQTGKAIESLARLDCKNAVSFTSDHIETLYEIDFEYVKHGRKLGMEIVRAESLNGSPVFVRALANIAAAHLRACEEGRGSNVRFARGGR
ncbi:hypothetical protein EIP86_003425 [Pleurotus ostreatoroseus]|nr:hypothetical protein EIP86_003425 [Pleurotus ostreatoroseus]